MTANIDHVPCHTINTIYISKLSLFLFCKYVYTTQYIYIHLVDCQAKCVKRGIFLILYNFHWIMTCKRFDIKCSIPLRFYKHSDLTKLDTCVYYNIMVNVIFLIFCWLFAYISGSVYILFREPTSSKTCINPITE